MIVVEHVSKSFGGIEAVRDIGFEVPRGSVVGLLGSNGAGKTTTIRMVTGFLPPDRGRVTIDGMDTIDRSIDARRRIGYLAESSPAYAEMTVRGYLDFRAKLYGRTRGERRTGIARALAMCELGDVEGRRIGHLSKGYRQRVGLAAAVVHDPPVLVLDEPGNALDPRQIRATRALVRQLAAEGGGRAVLVSSHILPEVERTCDRVVVMVRGRVRADARPEQLLAGAASRAAYVVELVGPAEMSGRVELVLAGVQGVESVKVEGAGSVWRARVETAAGAGDLREPISRACTGAGLVVRELTRERATLERVFMELVEGEEHSR